MTDKSDKRRPIPPQPSRWHSNPDPASIHVPGLDTTAPVHDQIEQIEQLITIKLQNIDENFSKIHHLLATKLLPAVKRYAVGTEPVREAAKFWTSFYEQAAQIRIPSADDHSTVNEVSGSSESTETPQAQDPSNVQTTPSQSHLFEPSLATTDTSFMPGQAAFSSTPAAARGPQTEDTFATHRSDDPSWMSSVESPLVRLDREFHEFSMDDSATGPTNVSTLKFQRKPKTPASIVKKYNPYLPPDTDPANWSGVVDLRDPSIATPRRRKGKSSRQAPAAHAKESDDDDSFDGLPPGMSPPVMMSPARPPRSSAELGLLKVGQTPKTEVSARIKRDLLRDVQYSREIESSMSTVPTPPSLSRYNRFGMDTTDSIVIDSSLESMMRRVGLNVPSTLRSTPGLRLRSQASQKAAIPPSNPPQPIMTAPRSIDEPSTSVPEQPHVDVDSDSDSLDEVNNTAHPSAAFLMASSQASRDSDDSFGSSNHSSDSLNEDDDNGLVPVHPFAQGIQNTGYDDDDSYDDDLYDGGPAEEETLFGVPPAQRLRAQGGLLGDNLRMLGEDLLEDTIGIGSQMARSGRVEESPTPAPRN